MKRKIFLVFLSVLMLTFFSCRIDETGMNQFLGFEAGNAMGIVINEKVPQADKELTDAWKDMMKANESNTIIPSADVIAFYNQSVFILGSHVDMGEDKYGLMGHLTALLAIFGGTITDGKLTAVEDVPKSVMIFFGRGYVNGRNVVIN